MAFKVPSSCTLPSAEHPVRIAEFEALFARALSSRWVSDQNLRVRFADTGTTAVTVRDLAARESACCSFFEFAVTGGDGRVVLDVVVPAGRSEILDGLAAVARVDTQ
ncbi:MAG: hypothetical protein ACRDQU_04185 [Pseudonocardiaceae bacterium]